MSKEFTAEEIVLDIDAPEVGESFKSGFMPDWFNYKTLVFSMFFIIGLILTFIFGTAQLFHYYQYQIEQETLSTLKYVDTAALKDADRLRLSTTGVIDAEKGVYHIPIDSAIELLTK